MQLISWDIMMVLRSDFIYFMCFPFVYWLDSLQALPAFIILRALCQMQILLLIAICIIRAITSCCSLISDLLMNISNTDLAQRLCQGENWLFVLLFCQCLIRRNSLPLAPWLPNFLLRNTLWGVYQRLEIPSTRKETPLLHSVPCWYIQNLDLWRHFM